MKKTILTAALLGCVAIMTAKMQATADELTPHLVQEGDNLWSLSEHYLSDPDRWSEIWQVNPELTNPHWIYPGQIVLIPLAPPPPPKEEVVIKPPPIVSTGEPLPMQVTTPFRPKVAEEPEVDERLAAIQAELARQYDRGIGMVTWELPTEGRVLGSEVGWHHAASHQTVLIDAPGAQPGQRLGIYRDLGRVDAQRYLGKSPGHLLADVGIIKVIAPEGGKQRAVVERSFTEIKQGDLLGPVPPVPEVTAESLDKDAYTIPATVVAVKHHRMVAASDNVVYLDRGENDGLAPGQSFTVHSPDSSKNARRRGELLILRVTPERAAALVTSASTNHVRPGDLLGQVR
ncbi:LysM peptidoglycan-binding domain-containing protein [Desulfurivibrio alkaliphilus]|uniref:Peptidoglycan-binding lysin domain protein n=1 Tax=Desulfurivibrio alkaliphilus (strain DSM 19089 / UNIQEM U267 / AHT2) TaxID=589865 RepID=D6Z612_DESAT|nr:LysM peptidoglycan-binding domain-containing protein [Desulfurivibrio alkaliphilus]ADH84894.1 Peptidoglycan-binding lysin domain protein [Desulfurivibrio alkaliphilus AHT 2]